MENELLKSIHVIGESPKSGTIFAADDVFSTVVGLNASEVEGVMGLADLNTGELITKMNNKSLNRALRFDFTEGAVTALIGIIVVAGSNLLSVSRAVQHKVSTAVEDIIGVTLKSVNIQISDVRSR